MLAEIVKITIPDWICSVVCVTLSGACVALPWWLFGRLFISGCLTPAEKSGNHIDKYGPKINADNFEPILGQGEQLAPKTSKTISYNNASLNKVFSCSDIETLVVLGLAEAERFARNNEIAKDVIPYSDSAMHAMSIVRGKRINCSICNDKGSIQGRQCSCQVAKYWKDKC